VKYLSLFSKILIGETKILVVLNRQFLGFQAYGNIPSSVCVFVLLKCEIGKTSEKKQA